MLGEVESDIILIDIDDVVTPESKTEDANLVDNEVQSTLNAIKRKISEDGDETAFKKIKQDNGKDEECPTFVNGVENSASNSSAEFVSEEKSVKQLKSVIDDDKNSVTGDLHKTMVFINNFKIVKH